MAVLTALTLLTTSLPSPTARAATFDELLLLVPEEANALVMLNMDKILDSTPAQSGNWRKKLADLSESTSLLLPPSARQFLLATDLDIEHMQPRWQAAAMELSIDPSPREIAEHLGGILDSFPEPGVSDSGPTKIGAIWSQDHTCIVKFNAHQFGLLSPTNRQTAARWVRDTPRRELKDFSPYLRQAVGYSDRVGTEIIMAIDLEGILRWDDVRRAVDQSPLLKSIDHQKAAQILASVRGITLGIRLGKQPSGKLKIDFGQDTTLFQEIAKPLILKILAQAGASLDEFEAWTPEVREQQIAIGGPLTDAGMRRIFSLALLDASKLDTVPHPGQTTTPPPGVSTPKKKSPATGPQAADAPKADAQRAMAHASRRYFQKVNKYLNDLERPRKNKTLAKVTLWMTNFARKIDRLPTYRIDPQMAAYGKYVASRMRDAVASIHGSQDRAATRIAGTTASDGKITVGMMPTYRTVNYGGYRTREYAPFAYGNVDIAGGWAKREKIQAEELGKGIEEAQKIMAEVNEEMYAIRKIMTDRYSLEF